jgi:hypothetical protein
MFIVIKHVDFRNIMGTTGKGVRCRRRAPKDVKMHTGRVV